MLNINSLNLSAKEKAAILIMSLPTDISVHIMRELGTSQKDLASEIAKVGKYPEKVKKSVIDEFLRNSGMIENAEEESAITFTSPFTQISPSEEISFGAPSRQKPLDFLLRADQYQLLSIIRREHPQTIALILSQLNPQKASAILVELSSNLQTEVARRLAEIRKISPEILEEIKKVLEERLYMLMEGESFQEDGKETLVKILSEADRNIEEKILSGLTEKNPALVNDIKTKLSDFEDLLNIDDNSLKQVLHLTDLKDLTLALKGAPQLLVERIYKTLDKESSEALYKDVEELEVKSSEEIKVSKQQIRNILRGLMTLGKIKFK